jgi:hypothetical protein
MGHPRRNIQLDRQLAELQSYTVEVFGDHDAAIRWLDTGLSELDNLSPREIVTRAGADGLERARDVLLRIEYASSSASNTECTVSLWPPATGCFAGSTPLPMPPGVSGGRTLESQRHSHALCFQHPIACLP